MKTYVVTRDLNGSYALWEWNGVELEKGEKLVIVGCSGAGGPAAMMAKKLMPDIDVTVIRKEDCFIVR